MAELDIDDMRQMEAELQGMPLCNTRMTFYYDETGNCGKFKVTDVNVSENSVTFEITCKATGDRKHEITLSDAGNSYAMVGEEGNIIGAKKAVADAAADQVIFVLLGANRADKTVCTITSGTKNQTLSDNGAKETLFAVKE